MHDQRSARFGSPLPEGRLRVGRERDLGGLDVPPALALEDELVVLEQQPDLGYPRERHVEDRVERCVQQVDKAKRRAGSTADGQHGLELPIALDKLVLESADQEKIANEKTATRQPRRGARE